MENNKLIRKYLLDRGLSIKKMCEDLQINESGFNRNLKENKFKTNTLERVFEYLGVTEKIEEEKSNGIIIEYLEKAVRIKDETIMRLSEEIGVLKKELGKYNRVSLA